MTDHKISFQIKFASRVTLLHKHLKENHKESTEKYVTREISLSVIYIYICVWIYIWPGDMCI